MIDKTSWGGLARRLKEQIFMSSGRVAVPRLHVKHVLQGGWALINANSRGPLTPPRQPSVILPSLAPHTSSATAHIYHSQMNTLNKKLMVLTRP